MVMAPASRSSMMATANRSIFNDVGTARPSRAQIPIANAMNPARSIRQATWQNWSSGLRQVANLSQTFSLDACRHGCMMPLPRRYATENSFFEHLGLVGGFLLVAAYDLHGCVAERMLLR
jgi:hypothetical protein